MTQAGRGMKFKCRWVGAHCPVCSRCVWGPSRRHGHGLGEDLGRQRQMCLSPGPVEAGRRCGGTESGLAEHASSTGNSVVPDSDKGGGRADFICE